MSAAVSNAPTFGALWLELLNAAFPDMTQAQASALLSKEGALPKAMAVGADKGRSGNIRRWLNSVLQNRRQIAQLINTDPRKEPATFACLSPIFACFYSSDSRIVRLAAQEKKIYPSLTKQPLQVWGPARQMQSNLVAQLRKNIH